MEFKKDSGKLVKWLTPQLKTYMARKKMSKSYDKLLLSLYNEVHMGVTYVDKLKGTKCLEPVVETLKKTLVYNTSYFPEKIQEFIREYITNNLIYTCNISGRDIRITFGIFGDVEHEDLEKYDEYASFIYSWIFVCYKFASKNCAKTLDIKIFLTTVKKTLPSDKSQTLGANEVNTAFTYSCQPKGEIVLYRVEEWKKVFIHETFHTFGFDFNRNNARDIYTYHNERFNIQSKFNIEEAYVETWSRIMNAAYNSYYSLKIKSNKDDFLTYMKFSLHIEGLFSLYGLNKVLNHMGLTYEMLIDTGEISRATTTQLYRENSNVLAYYVITGVLMNDVDGFLGWCSKHNTNLFKFNASDISIKSFIHFLDESYTNEVLLKILKKIRKNKKGGYIGNTTRMTAIEVVY